MSFLLNAVEAQGGVPSYVWIIVGVIAVILALVFAIKSFWVSKSISILLSIAGIVLSIKCLSNIEALFVYTLVAGAAFAVSHIFLMGNAIFDSKTEGDYLIAGSLVHDTNHPLEAFGGSVAGILILTGLIFWAAYAWTFVIALVAFIITLGLNVSMIIKRVRG